jgi:GT2 family glycosyltransferase
VASLSIIVPTFDRPDYVGSLLEDVITQAPLDAEIVVVDQSPRAASRRTADRIAQLADLRVRHLPVARRGLPEARNVGLSATRAPVVLFLDDDVRLLAGSIAAHLRAFACPATGGVVGRILERTVAANARRTTNRLGAGGRIRTNLTGTRRVPVETLKGANMSLRRSVLDRIGGFDPNYLGTALLEDADVSVRVSRAGYRLWFEPAARVVHLSAERGGVRTGDVRTTERWRFHNTAYFVRRHRGPWHLAPLVATFSAIAVKRAAGWRDPAAFRMLMDALREGWDLAGTRTPTEGSDGP